jgi:hypothetical protein
VSLGVEVAAAGDQDEFFGPVGAEYCVVAGRAAFRYSLMSLPTARATAVLSKYGVPVIGSCRATDL